MEFDNAFEVALPPDKAWALLMDIQRIAPCMPGAQLIEKVDERTYKGKVGVRLGPVALTFAGTAKFEDIDEAGYTARVKAAGTDSKGRGGANSTVTFKVVPDPVGSKVQVHTDLTLSGSVAQYGRGAGIINEVAAQLIAQFAARLRQSIETELNSHPEGTSLAASLPIETASPPATPISGFALLFGVLKSLLRRFFSKK